MEEEEADDEREEKTGAARSKKNGVIVNLSASEDATRTRIVLILVHHLSMCGIEFLGETTGKCKRQKTDVLAAGRIFFWGGEVRRGTTSPFIVVVEKEKREPNPNPTQSPRPNSTTSPPPTACVVL